MRSGKNASTGGARMPDNNPQQLSLFGDTSGSTQNDDTPPQPPELTLHASTALTHALEIYIHWLKEQNLSKYTVKAFRSDMSLFTRWAGKERAVGDFGTSDLNEFLHWMQHERGKPCSPKTYARRVTTLKNFFGFLHTKEAIQTDPSNAVIQKTVQSPLPSIPNEEQIERLLATAEAQRHAEKPDSRPYFLIQLLLQTGMKKSECMALKPHDFIREGYNAPAVWVHYDDPKNRYKERTIPIEEELLGVLDEYLTQRTPDQVVFDCTARNLEYVLRYTAEEASVPRTVISFEALRWTSAVHDFRAGMDANEQRIKMGLSDVTYKQTRTRLRKIASRMGYTIAQSSDDD